MIYNSKWVFPAMRKSTTVWNYASSVTIVAFGLFTKLLICILNKQRVYNKDVFINAIKYRPNNVPLITVSNHHSCFDDPGIWASLPLNQVFSPSRFRWILAAHDIVFTNYFHSLIFALGKCVPTIRGAGVYQDAVDFCIEKLNIGEWIHVFPEGKVNMTKENLRLKWGIGRLIFESKITPIVIPIWHLGMDELLPNYPPYRFRLRKRLTFNFGQPIDFTEILRKIRETNLNAMEARKFITDKIQSELNKLKLETEMLHKISMGL